ncbi:MAG TPA: YfhO family protein, partial [Firmicutes bacterium]|nr:YfhO family protein [Bacillota bacterium]
MIQQQSRWGHWKAFGLALAMAAVMFLPFVIMDGGCFFYYGDFNVQQIPFYRLAHEAVRSGDIFWSWTTDLGANFIGSYSFYLLFSPFFWLTLPFPVEAIPYLMAPLLALKFATAALTSCLYIRRFVKEEVTAVMGSLLYAFSGWMIYNVFFNHFLEVAAFFPLLLVALEELMVENRRGLFALAVALNAMVNYWFFIGEVVFVVLYFFVRCTSPQWKASFGGFCKVAFEAILGVGLAMAALLPSALAILGNPRTGTDKLLSGWSLWL